MDIDAFSLRDVQTFIALLSMAESAGVIQTGDLRHLLQARINTHLAERKTAVDKMSRKLKGTKNEVCPSCGRGRLVPAYNQEGAVIMGCRLCRFSRIEAT